tara:strand:+ start:25556 stop:27046 length:1491 start_codon:yes stop_codon:yes gene_type:complete
MNTKLENQEEAILREFFYETMQLSVPDKTLIAKPRFHPISPKIFEREYVVNILGIDLPLNESYPYSGPVYAKILKEQKHLENFLQCSDNEIWLLVEQDEAAEDESGWSWAKAARLAGDLKTGAAALKVMFTDKSGSKIEEFVSTAMEIITEPFDTMKTFFTTIAEKAKEWGVTVFEKIGEFAQKIWGWITDAVDYVKGLSGWKSVLATGTVVAGIMYLWKKYGPDWIKPMMDKLNQFNALISGGGKKNETYVHTHGLVAALYADDDQLNEFLGFGKKKKKDKWEKKAQEIEDEEKVKNMTDEERKEHEEKRKKSAQQKTGKADERDAKAKSAEEFADDPEAAAEKKAEELKNTWWGQMGMENLSDEQKEEGASIIQWFKDKFIKGLWAKAKGVFKGMAKNAAISAASGGFSSWIKGLGKLYNGTSFVFKTLRPAFQQAVEPNDIKAATDEEGGEEQFWARGTDREEEVDKESKEKKNEALLRSLVREALLSKEVNC